MKTSLASHCLPSSCAFVHRQHLRGFGRSTAHSRVPTETTAVASWSCQLLRTHREQASRRGTQTRALFDDFSPGALKIVAIAQLKARWLGYDRVRLAPLQLLRLSTFPLGHAAPNPRLYMIDHHETGLIKGSRALSTPIDRYEVQQPENSNCAARCTAGRHGSPPARGNCVRGRTA